ncbi:MAG: hypothetical protein HOP15_00570 [Planctomycetes bacterium]|nr:hypothetical protein [Planctomycetota bacterium]
MREQEDATCATSLRPHRALAVDGLAHDRFERTRARIVDTLEREQWTPLGLRTLPRWDPRYQGCDDSQRAAAKPVAPRTLRRGLARPRGPGVTAACRELHT